MCAHKQLQISNDNSVHVILLKQAHIIMHRKIVGNHNLCLFQLESTKTIRLSALDFYEVIVDLAFGLINYCLLEISK